VDLIKRTVLSVLMILLFIGCSKVVKPLPNANIYDFLCWYYTDRQLERADIDISCNERRQAQ
jgi:hypothetical protein